MFYAIVVSAIGMFSVRFELPTVPTENSQRPNRKIEIARTSTQEFERGKGTKKNTGASCWL
jgi:hypothetical protein